MFAVVGLTGVYHVSVAVTNKFSQAVTHLCPDVVVVDATVPVPTCRAFTAHTSNDNSLAEPLQRMRSSEVSLAVSVIQDCTPPVGYILQHRCDPCVVYVKL